MFHDSVLACVLADLGRAMQLAGSAISRLAEAEARERESKRPRKTYPANLAFGKHKSQPTVGLTKFKGLWPRIGGHDFSAPSRDVFASAEYKSRYKPGECRDIYVAACNGVRRLSAASGVPQNKVSTCKAGSLPSRLRAIGREGYGSIIIRDGKEIVEGGFQQWKIYSPPKSLAISPNSPVTLQGTVLRAHMPISMSSLQFDDKFDELVIKGSPYLEQGSGSVANMLPHRFTVRKRHGAHVTEIAKEIVVFRSRGDFDRLVAIIEQVILEHLGL